MAKTPEDLRASREAREEIIDLFDGVRIESILLQDKNVQAKDAMAEKRSYSNSGMDVSATGRLSKSFAISCGGARYGALSRFPQNIGRILVRFYTSEGETVVDPFAGHNSRMELCWRENRNYIGHDCCKEFMEANHKVRVELLQEAQDDMFHEHFRAWIRLHECDSRKMPTESGIGDFTITSPPYWDLEFYGNENEQLGTGKSYDEFLTGLADVAKENFRCLRPGAFCVWCVNDFRKDGRFYSYHEHTAELLRAAGFIQHDIAITDFGPSFRGVFLAQAVKQKIIPKRHEYCLVFRKPEVNENVRIHVAGRNGSKIRDAEVLEIIAELDERSQQIKLLTERVSSLLR